MDFADIPIGKRIPYNRRNLLKYRGCDPELSGDTIRICSLDRQQFRMRSVLLWSVAGMVERQGGGGFLSVPYVWYLHCNGSNRVE
jgi:hypothetical protein